MPACSPYSDGSGIGGAFTYDAVKGDLTVKGGKTATLAAGTYCFHNVTVGGGATLRAAGAVGLALTGKLDAGGGSSLVTASSAPSDLKIRSSYTGGGGVSLGGGCTAYATALRTEDGHRARRRLGRLRLAARQDARTSPATRAVHYDKH